MRTRNTYVALLLAVAAGATLSIVSCAPDATTPTVASAPDPAVTQEKVQDLRDKFGWIGQYHTDGLAYIYNELAKSKGKSRKPADLCRVAAKALKEFHRINRKRDIPVDLVDKSLVDETCENGQAGSIRSTLLSGALPGRVRSDELSGTATSYLNQLEYLSQSATSRSDFLNGVYSIEAQAVNTLSESEAGAVSAVASVARSSADYWDVNLSSWVSLSDGTFVPYTVMTNGDRAGVASVSGPRGISYGWGPAARYLGKVLGADILSGARVVATSWFVGPVAWEAAAAAALWGSGVAGIALVM